MIGRPSLNLCRIAVSALVVSAPSLIVLAGLVGSGLLDAGVASAAGGVIWVATALVIGRSVSDLRLIRDAVESLRPDYGGDSLSRHIDRRLAPGARELWLAIVGVERLWRERTAAAERQLLAAEAVISAIPDPLILLDERRQIVRANAQAAAFVGSLAAPRDLSVALRNPAVLAAADAVLRGQPAEVVDFGLAIPIDRQLRARIARIERRSLDARSRC